MPSFVARSVDRCVEAAKPVWKLLGADPEERVRVIHPDCGHGFSRESRMASYEFLDERLKGKKAR